jgi:hypothetical protein
MTKRSYLLFRQLWLLIIVILTGGCQEIYNPEVDSLEGIIVVEGLITNLNEPSFVKITIAKQYKNSSRRDSLVTRASVIIMEDNQSNYLLHEADSGYYVTNPLEFVAKPGHTYTLQITTRKGEKYQSTPQLMLPPATIDSLYGEILDKEYIYKDVHGKTVGKMEEGAQTFADFKSNTALPVQYRFKSTLLVGSKYVDKSTSPYPSVVYIWEKQNPDNTIILTGSAGTNTISSGTAYPVNFYPFNEYLYGMGADEHIENWFLQVRQYSINNETYLYYNEVNKLISSTGALFDPIASQLTGNISCTSNPDLEALGFFEVSGCVKRSCYIKPHTDYNTIDYSPTYDLDTIPALGKSINHAPAFWQF